MIEGHFNKHCMEWLGNNKLLFDVAISNGKRRPTSPLTASLCRAGAFLKRSNTNISNHSYSSLQTQFLSRPLQIRLATSFRLITSLFESRITITLEAEELEWSPRKNADRNTAGRYHSATPIDRLDTDFWKSSPLEGRLGSPKPLRSGSL